MSPQELIAELDRAVPGFRACCESDENLFPRDTPHGVFAACSRFVRERPVSSSSWERIAVLVNGFVGGDDDDLDNAACTCFLENLAEPDHPLKPLLRGEALAYWDHWDVTSALNRCSDRLLALATEDWLMAADVASVAVETGGATKQKDARDLSLRIIRHLAGLGLMEIGDLSEKAFMKWDLPIEAALERVERDWTTLDRFPGLGEVCWLRNTPAGDAQGERIIKERDAMS